MRIHNACELGCILYNFFEVGKSQWTPPPRQVQSGPSSEIGEVSDRPSCGGERNDTIHRVWSSLLPPITTPKLDQKNDLVNGNPILEDGGIENGGVVARA